MMHWHNNILLPPRQAVLKIAAVAAARLHRSTCQLTELVLHLQALQAALQQNLCWQQAVGLLLKPHQAVVGQVS